MRDAGTKIQDSLRVDLGENLSPISVKILHDQVATDHFLDIHQMDPASCIELLRVSQPLNLFY